MGWSEDRREGVDSKGGMSSPRVSSYLPCTVMGPPTISGHLPYLLPSYQDVLNRGVPEFIDGVPHIKLAYVVFYQ